MEQVGLPIYAYFDKAYFEKEIGTLFNIAPKYYGHELMVPSSNDYHTLNWLNNAKVLKRSGSEIKLLSNICRHRQAIILNGRGNSNHMVCNLHGWTYNNDGKLIGAPKFEEIPCLKLTETKLVNWHGILFDASRDIAKDLASSNIIRYINFTNYNYSNTIVTDYNFNWKTFIEVYSEDYHVDPFHPGLGNFVDCNAIAWEFGDWYHVQLVPIKQELKYSGSEAYKNWQTQIKAYYNGETPKFGAIWFTYYPNIMIECYPQCIVISIAIPIAPEKTKVVTDFFYPEEILAFEPEYVEAEQKAYFETAKEDDEICNRMHQGRRALYFQGLNENGPYQEPTEAGLKHFHDFLKKQINL